MLNYPYKLGINPAWCWGMICLMYCWMLLASILFKFLCLFSSGISAYSFLSLLCLCLVSTLKYYWIHRECLEWLPLSISEGLVNWSQFTWNTLKKSLGKPSGSRLFFFGRNLITFLTFIMVICLFRFSIMPWFSFRRWYVSRNLSISSKSSVLLVYNCV